MRRANPGQSVIGGYLPSAVTAFIFLMTLLFNAFSYAALASHKEIGNAFRLSIEHNSPFIEAYVWLGDVLRGLPGLSTVGDATATAAAEPLLERIRPHPRGADAIFFGKSESSAQSSMQWGHRMLPFLLLIAVVMWWRRQKPVHMRKRLRA